MQNGQTEPSQAAWTIRRCTMVHRATKFVHRQNINFKVKFALLQILHPAPHALFPCRTTYSLAHAKKVFPRFAALRRFQRPSCYASQSPLISASSLPASFASSSGRTRSFKSFTDCTKCRSRCVSSFSPSNASMARFAF